MDTDRWKQICDLLHAALERPEQEQEEYLRQACGGDAELLEEVRSLLAAHHGAGSFLDSPAYSPTDMPTQTANPSLIAVTFRSMVGVTVSHYRVLSRLGSGGMGVVYEAEDIKLGRRVAIKFLPGEVASDRTAFERMRREARSASALDHPNICSIYELGEHDGQPFIVMQLLEGETLREWINRNSKVDKRSRLNGAIDLAIQITHGLEAAHQKNIIHRDIKPENIFVTVRGEVKILDFGLAKFAAPKQKTGSGDEDTLLTAAPLTRGRAALGTVAYMSPEQARAKELDPRTDLFSFGAVLYEMATGQRPFQGETDATTYDAILNRDPEPAFQLNKQVSPRLEEIIGKALEKDRELRYQHASDMGKDLQRLKRDSESGRVPAASSGSVAAARGIRTHAATRNLWKIVISALVTAAALLGGGIFYRSHQAKPLTDKDTLVLADFVNTTGDPVFDDTLKTALSVSLNQSPFLNVLSENRVVATLRLMTRAPDTRLTPEVAPEVCERAGGKAYVAGSIASLGSQYVVGLKAVNCRSGDLLAQEQATAVTKEKVLNALGQAVSKLRGELGESLVTVQKFDVPLAEATTSSLEALKAYSLGARAFRETGNASSLPYHLRAVELDPNFAMGYEAVGQNYFGLSELGRASVYFTRAFELREHTSEREKLRIISSYYENVTGELEKSAQNLQEDIENYPRDFSAHNALGLVYAEQGQYDKAADEYSEDIRLAPENITWYDNLGNTLLALQRFDEARRTIQQMQARKLDDFIARQVLYARAFLTSDAPAMAEQQQWFAGKSRIENFGLSLASDTEAYAGHLGKARQMTKWSVESAIRADSKEGAALWQENAALREAAFGEEAEARQAAAQGLILYPASQAVQVEAALAFAMAGDAVRTESLAQDLNKRFPLHTQMQSLWLPAIRAQLALDRKDSSEAVSNLQTVVAPIELGQIYFAANISCLYPTYIRGQAYLAVGQGKEAAAEFQKIIDHSGIVWNCWTGALAHLGVARANALQARTSQGADADLARSCALAAYKDFLTLWKDADPDTPVLKEAKAEYAKLQ